MTRSEYIRIIKNKIRESDLVIKKRLGQNFLVDKNVIRAMVEAAQLKSNDVVLEIGPGLGFLTEEIMRNSGKVIAIEKDKGLYQILQEKNRKNLKIINGDIFAVNLDKHGLKDLEYKIVSNIPYYLTSKLIRYFTETKIRPKVMVVLVQKEVADRVVAEAGSHSLLSLSVQFYGKPEKIMDVDRNSFFPMPDINSAILKINLRPKPIFEDVDEKKFFRMLKIAFSSRRKQLHNNLSSGFKISSEEIKKIFTDIGFNYKIRAQNLDLSRWRKLYNKLIEKNYL